MTVNRYRIELRNSVGEVLETVFADHEDEINRAIRTLAGEDKSPILPDDKIVILDDSAD